MSSAEFAEWQQYYGLEPFGAWRDNWHAGTVAALIFNANRGKGQRALSVSDFMYLDPESAEKKRDDEMLAMLRAKAGG